VHAQHQRDLFVLVEPVAAADARCRPDETLRGYVAGRGAARLEAAAAAGGRWIRFGESTSPDRDFERLLGRFVDRFGNRPVANSVEDDEPAGSRGASHG